MNIILNTATGYELPPFLLFDKKMEVERPLTTTPGQYSLGQLWQDRVGIKWDDESDFWYFPFDPVVSINGKNTIVRRNVLKQNVSHGNRRGSIKELWSIDDYTIDIAGVLKYDDVSYSKGDFESDLLRLRNYVEGRRLLQIQSELLATFNISAIAVESYSFPFTKGIENQMFNIKAYSDDQFDLLIKE